MGAFGGGMKLEPPHPAVSRRWYSYSLIGMLPSGQTVQYVQEVVTMVTDVLIFTPELSTSSSGKAGTLYTGE